jgi:hypothetical protein
MHESTTRWGVGLKDEEITVTTQKLMRSDVHPTERRFRTKNIALRYNHLKCCFNSDSFFSGAKSLQQNTCGHCS